jgi:hypothetical protein
MTLIGTRIGTVELAQGVTIPVEGIHTTAPFKIVGALACNLYL